MNRRTLFFFFLLGLALIVWSSENTRIILNQGNDRPLLLPPEKLGFFTLGYSETAADLLWLRTIQDFDYCEQKATPNARSDEFRCERGWVFHMIDAVVGLAPRFRDAYLYGGIMLSVIVNDIEGASMIFDKGTRQFPHDGKLAFTAAYHAMVEEKNPEKASLLLTEAGKSGMPPWVFALAARLQTESGRLELAKQTLEDALQLRNDGPGAERIQKRLDEVNAELAKQQASEQKH